MNMTKEMWAILDHTASRCAGGLYCGDSPDMQKLVLAGLMVSAGRKGFVPDEYFQLTRMGKDIQSEGCRNCGAIGFKPSVALAGYCQFCDGTEGGNGPGTAEFERMWSPKEQAAHWESERHRSASDNIE